MPFEVANAIEQIQQMESAEAASGDLAGGADESGMDTQQLMEALELATEEEKRRLFEAGRRGDELPVGLRISTTAEGPGVIQGYRLSGRFSKTDEYTVQVRHQTLVSSARSHCAVRSYVLMSLTGAVGCCTRSSRQLTGQRRCVSPS